MAYRSAGLLATIIIALLASVLQGVHSYTSSDTLDTVKVTVSTYPPGQPLIVDGVIYFTQPGAPLEFDWPRGSVHRIEIVVDTVYLQPGVRLVFDRWNLGSSDGVVEFRAGEATAVVAIYQTQYYLEVYSPYGSAAGSGWYPAGSYVEIKVDPVVPLGEGSRAVFVSWSEGGNPLSPETTVYMFEPKVIEAYWEVEHLVSARATIEGVYISGSGWYREGSIAVLSAPREVKLAGDEDAVWRFSGWLVRSGSVPVEDLSSSTISFVVNGPVELEAVYEKYYLVDVDGVAAEAEGAGYYREGDRAVIRVPPTVTLSDDTRLVFAGWEGVEARGPQATIEVEGPVKAVALWETQYRVSVEASVPEASGAVSGGGWYAAGSEAVIKAAEEVPGRFGVKYVFAGWEGDYTGGSPTAKIRVNGPLQLKAVYVKDYTGFYLNMLAVGIVGAGLYSIYAYLIPLAAKRVSKVRNGG